MLGRGLCQGFVSWWLHVPEVLWGPPLPGVFLTLPRSMAGAPTAESSPISCWKSLSGVRAGDAGESALLCCPGTCVHLNKFFPFIASANSLSCLQFLSKDPARQSNYSCLNGRKEKEMPHRGKRKTNIPKCPGSK